MNNFTGTDEKSFEDKIYDKLKDLHGYRHSLSEDYNKEFAMNLDQLWEFIKTTQPEKYESIKARKGERAFLSRLDSQIKKGGVLKVLQTGVKHKDLTVDLFYRKPSSSLNPSDIVKFQSNIFSVTRQLYYSTDNKNSIDLAIFLNGLPIITAELKNNETGQTVRNAMIQYQEDRDPKEKLLSFARCMVHFAVDNKLVFMTTKLNGKGTFFLPFNRGLNKGLPFGRFGAGNPNDEVGFLTKYLWEEILAKESLANIIDKFAKVIEEEDPNTGKKNKKQIFPRYHQLTAVREILEDVKENGIGYRYLIQHSAGSGKSKSIAWLAHQLHSLFDKTGTKNLFDSVIVITDRIVLDTQLSNDIIQFSPAKSIVEHITGKSTSKTSQLRTALGNRKKVIVCTIQTFPFLLDEMTEMPKMNFAIIIDEAHSGQSGQTSSKMNAVLADKNEEIRQEEKTLEDKINELIESKKMITNGSYFAFTATPKNKTLETFGKQYDDDIEYYAFHVYSMKQAIEEGFILDVLKNYTTYNSYYKLIKQVEDNPIFDVKRANKKLRNYVEGHEFAIEEKAKIMIDNFHNHAQYQINRKAKAMVVTKGIECAIKYKMAFDSYLEEIHSPYKAIIAFSGTKEYKGIDYDETSMNDFAEYKNDIPRNFKKDIYRFLIVAEKYQTGFDEPLLHTMYVDKKLSDIQAVQTLSRLNRSYKPHKKDTFVLDFYNNAEDIRKAFAPYFTSTSLMEGTDPNKLHDLLDELDNYDIYDKSNVDDFFEKLVNGKDRSLLETIANYTVEEFSRRLSKGEQIDFKIKAKAFVRVYSYLVKILDFKNHSWEKMFWFLKYLVPKLFIEQEEDMTAGLLESIDMDSYRPTNQGKENIALTDDIGYIEPIPVDISARETDAEFDKLDKILDDFNKRFGDIPWSDGDKVKQVLVNTVPADIQADKSFMERFNNSDKQNSRIESDKIVNDMMIKLLTTHTEIFKKFQNDPDFKKRYQDYIFNRLLGNRGQAGI